ncbi:MAG: PKD domain-containing protein [Candidatus Zixiibacteriota bacterium]|nr:MAG: PKD domain-containing protein [candidate division Zixibacteria bacterium]
MSYLSGYGRKTQAALPIFLAGLAFLLLVAAPVMAQLTEADIDQLREQGKQEGWTFEVGLNPATNYPLEQICGYKRMENPPQPTMQPSLFTSMEIPPSWDWRDRDGVTPVGDQGSCGSCWAFASIAALESAIRIKDGVTLDFSEQWLVSCNTNGWGCNGGNFAHDYYLAREDQCDEVGAVYERWFPYAARDLPCDGCPYPRDYLIQGWTYVGTANKVPPVDSMKLALMQWGPLAVAVYVNAAFQSYIGGIFNGCEKAPTNHTVLLVGWDDDYYGESVWIIKNSWTEYWGDDGYMYIPWDCSWIGEGANYVDVGLPGYYFWGDNLVGSVPHEVNFDAFSPLTVDQWTWDFGDGDSAFIQAPSHTYEESGMFDVTLQVDIGGEIISSTKPRYIVAVADTARGPVVSATPNTQVEMVLTANNTAPVRYIRIPIEFANNFGMTYDSFSTVGCRTDYFEVQGYSNYDPWINKRVTLKLISSDDDTSPELDPGDGPVAKIYFSIPDTSTLGQSAMIYLDGYLDFEPTYYGSVADYVIGSVPGRVMLGETCCLNRGDADHNGSVDILDASYFADYLWRSGPDSPCSEEADCDGNEQVDILDLEYLISYFYRSGPPPVPCP